MPDRDQLVWLFFRFPGRVSRAAYLLAGLLLLVGQMFFLYQFMRVPEGSPASQVWALGFMAAFLVSLWSHVALSVKRLHDIGRPGILALALFIPVVSIVAFVALCIFPGEAGPNRYGQRTNSP